MALKKDLILENGIVLTYHRVVSVTNITNQKSIIEVASYLNSDQRQREKDWYMSNSKDNMNVYINATYFSKEYDKELNVDNAYEYLKTLDEFKDAEDVFEEIAPEEPIEIEEDIVLEEIPEVEDTIPEEIIENTEEIPEEIIENTEEIPEESTNSEELIETEEVKEEK